MPMVVDPGSLHPPLQLTFTTNGIIDRVGTISNCRIFTSGMRCRQF